MTAVNDKAIKAAGVAGVIKPGKTSVRVVPCFNVKEIDKIPCDRVYLERKKY